MTKSTQKKAEPRLMVMRALAIYGAFDQNTSVKQYAYRSDGWVLRSKQATGLRQQVPVLRFTLYKFTDGTRTVSTNYRRQKTVVCEYLEQDPEKILRELMVWLEDSIAGFETFKSQSRRYVS